MYLRFFVLLSVSSSVVYSKPILVIGQRLSTVSPRSNLIGKGTVRGSSSFTEDEDEENHKKFIPKEDKNKLLNDLPDTKQFYGENELPENNFHKDTEFSVDHKVLKPHHAAGFKNAYDKDNSITKSSFYDELEPEFGAEYLRAPKNHHIARTSDEDGRYFKIGGRSSFYNEGTYGRGYNPHRRFNEKCSKVHFQRHVAPHEGNDRYIEDYLHPYRSYRVMSPSYFRERVPLKTRLSMYENSNFLGGQSGSMPIHGPAEIFY